jgi:glycine betaine/proline transport system ATP-binding protein
MGVRSAIERLRTHDREYGYVVSPDQKLMGIVSVDSLKKAARASDNAKLREAFLPEPHVLTPDTPISALYGPLTQHPYGLPVVDENGRYRGAITRNTMLEFLHQQHTEDAA